ncbi:MAG: zinc-dependent dehydrogenase [Candidatus Omnitrophica bacterium]|nr:zinc-dependent dehydrogenase [Candidatus Omnitrophota bacterium]
MKAAILKSVENLELEEVPEPKPGPGELVIQVKACAVCGTDVKVYHHGHKHIVFPRITGHEVSGVVIKCGAGVTNYQPGDRVIVAPAIPCGQCHYCRRGYQTMCDQLKAIGYHYDGGFAEEMKVPAAAVANGCVNHIPQGVSFTEATLAEPLACVINGQKLSQVGLGDTVLILGAGPIGCLHAQLARAVGAGQVILAEVLPERLKMAEFTGAILVDLSREDIVEKVKQLTAGRMAERVIVAATSHQAQEKAVELVAKRGSVNFFGGLPKEKPVINLNSNLVHYGEFMIVGTHGSAPRDNELAIGLIARKDITAKAYLTSILPLEQIHEALHLAEIRQGLKVVVTPSNSDQGESNDG